VQRHMQEKNPPRFMRVKNAGQPVPKNRGRLPVSQEVVGWRVGRLPGGRKNRQSLKTAVGVGAGEA